MKKFNINKLYLVALFFITVLSINTLVFATGNTVIEGNGKKGNPYIINMDNARTSQDGTGRYVEIPYSTENPDFWFQVSGSNCDGTYKIEQDRENKLVKFIYIRNDNTIYYTRNEFQPMYIQAGTQPKITTAELELESKKAFVVKASEGNFSFKLENALESSRRRKYI